MCVRSQKKTKNSSCRSDSKQNMHVKRSQAQIHADIMLEHILCLYCATTNPVESLICKQACSFVARCSDRSIRCIPRWVLVAVRSNATVSSAFARISSIFAGSSSKHCSMLFNCLPNWSCRSADQTPLYPAA